MDKSVNPFDMLPDGDEGSEDLSVLVAKVSVATKVTHPSPSLVKTKTQNSALAQLPSKPLSPAEYVRNDRGTGRGRGGSGDRRNGYDNNGYQRKYHTNSMANGGNDDSQVRDGHGGGIGTGDSVSNGGNADNDGWQVVGGRVNGNRRGSRNYDGGKERRGQQINAKREEIKPYNAPEQGKTSDVPKKEEIKEMTLAEYEKVKLEKIKALEAIKSEVRKVALDKDMQILGKKKDAELSMKSEKDKLKKKKSPEKEEKASKSITLNAFLKPTEDEKKPIEHEKHSKSTNKGSDNGGQVGRAAWGGRGARGGSRGYAHDGGRGGRGGQGNHIGLHKEGSSDQPNNEENKHVPPPSPPSGFEVQFPVLGGSPQQRDNKGG